MSSCDGRRRARRALRLQSSQGFCSIDVDHLNTPRLVANQAGQAVWRWDQQEPFGVNPGDENPSGLGAFEFPLRFPGQYFDKETNLSYNLARDYDALIGRYIQSDPIGLEGGINTYAYVLNDPLRAVDPDGRQSVWVAQTLLQLRILTTGAVLTIAS